MAVRRPKIRLGSVPTTRFRIAAEADGWSKRTVASRPTSKAAQLTIARSEPCVTVSVGAAAGPEVASETWPAATCPPEGNAPVAGAVCAIACGSRNAAVMSTARVSGK